MILILATNLVALFFPILRNDDAVLYANIAKHIAISNDWIDLVLKSTPWLDKPHFPFWLTAISFKLLGVNSFAYILPGFIFNLIGAIYTYKLARYLFLNNEVALLSLIMYLSAIHLLISNSVDVRAEAYLLGTIIPASYYWLRYSNLLEKIDKFSGVDLILGAVFSASAMMTKGIFTVVTISSGIIVLYIYQGKFKQLLSLKWLVAIILSFVFILPELISLYLQFDMHPELTIFGHTHVSGVKWFFWGSQFGRFFNSGYIESNHVAPYHYLFFVHTFLWAFLPWSIIFIFTCFKCYKYIRIKSNDKKAAYVYLVGAFLPTFILFSLTKFQLDHYTNILIPFAAILSAHTIYNFRQNYKSLYYINLGLTVVLFIVGVILWVKLFPHYYLFYLYLLIVIGLWYYSYAFNWIIRLIGYLSLAISIIFLNVSFTLGKLDALFDVGYNIANYLNQTVEILPIVAYNVDSVTLLFYYNGKYIEESKLDGLSSYKKPYYLVFKREDTQKIKALYLGQLQAIKEIKGNTVDKILKNVLNPDKLEQNLINYEIYRVNAY